MLDSDHYNRGYRHAQEDMISTQPVIDAAQPGMGLRRACGIQWER